MQSSDSNLPAVSGREDIRDRLNRPIQDLRISLLDRCNFRCPYCMPEARYHADYQFLKRAERLSHDEIIRFADIAVQLGVSKLRLTGGEPLLDKQVVSLVGQLAKLQGVSDLALTTNGVLLAPVAQALADAGLHRVTVSLDSLDASIFNQMSGGKGQVQQVLKGIQAAEDAGLGPVKINVVVQRGVNEHTVLDIVEHFRGSKHIVRFIEFMDVGNRNAWSVEQVVPSAEILKSIQDKWALQPVNRNYPGEVASRYVFADGAGEIGFISSVTEPFCGACSRARLSADGKLYTCLFATAGTDFRDSLRDGSTDDVIAEKLKSVWLSRNDRYSELRGRAEMTESKIEMYRMGG